MFNDAPPSANAERCAQEENLQQVFLSLIANAHTQTHTAFFQLTSEVGLFSVPEIF